MENRVYLDANVILDFLSPQRKNFSKAYELVASLLNDGYKIVISEDILTNVYYIAKDKQKVVAFFDSIQTKWRIADFGQQVVSAALKMSGEFGYDLEDTLQCLCAKKEGCSIVVTGDKGFVDCGIEVYDYERFAREK